MSEDILGRNGLLVRLGLIVVNIFEYYFLHSALRSDGYFCLF